ncbi:NAD(P)-dependent oxidoreductase [Spirillospora sp. NPDC048819]|uniref:NAD(P)-dependent oxidoreductase n=1 Tax=Spirillospora sp. NPDC048819 TaxID=3155268 RepID=UPI0033F74C78
MDVLVSKAAHGDFGDLLTDAAPGARFLLGSAEGVTDAAGTPLTDPAPDVAWLSSDLFTGGAGVRWFAPLLVGSPRLRWVHSSTAGLDSPLFGRLRDRGVRVTGSHIYAGPVSEFVVRAVLDEFQDARNWRDAQAARTWRPHEFREIAGSTWAVVGLGDIGSAVARAATALGATVIGVARTRPDPLPSTEFVLAGGLPEVLPRSDVVVLARSADPDAPPLVDAALLAAMAPGSVLVNVARGSLVDEQALLAALDTGAPARAVLDVTAVEPLPPDNPLWTHPAVTLTPHTSGQGHGRYRRGAGLFAALLRELPDSPGAERPAVKRSTP